MNIFKIKQTKKDQPILFLKIAQPVPRKWERYYRTEERQMPSFFKIVKKMFSANYEPVNF